jgi:hypothetical protein
MTKRYSLAAVVEAANEIAGKVLFKSTGSRPVKVEELLKLLEDDAVRLLWGDPFVAGGRARALAARKKLIADLKSAGMFINLSEDSPNWLRQCRREMLSRVAR